MTGTTITTVSNIGISLSSATDNPVAVRPTGGINVTSGLYALAGDSTAFAPPSYFTVSNYGGVIDDTAPLSFGITLTGGGAVNNLVGLVSFPSQYTPGTISGEGYGVAISGGHGTISNAGTIQAMAASGVGVDLDAGGTVTNSNFLLRPHGAFMAVIEGGAAGSAVRITGGPGTVGNTGGLIGAGASVGVYLGAGGYVTNFNLQTTGQNGSISGTQDGIVAKGGATTVVNYGAIIGGTDALTLPAGYTNRLRVFPRASFSGQVDGGNTAGAAEGSTLELGAYPTALNSTGSLSGLGGMITNFSTVTFDSGTGWFLGGNSAGIAGGEIFQNFAAGDTINITGITGETIAGFNANTLTLGGSVPLDIIIPGTAATAANFQVFNDPTNGTDITTNLSCFAAGTRILTDRGEIAVERLREGDRIVTPLKGGTAPIVWIGHRHVRTRCHPRPETVQPVVVQPGAFGAGRPHRVLRLSPDHAVFMDDILIPIGLLINGRSIARADVAEVTYYHVELPEHDVLYAEGLTCETYLATGDSTAFDNQGGAVALHVAFAPAAIWETMGCAPLIKSGARLDELRERLRALAGPPPADSRAA